MIFCDSRPPWLIPAWRNDARAYAAMVLAWLNAAREWPGLNVEAQQPAVPPKLPASTAAQIRANCIREFRR